MNIGLLSNFWYRRGGLERVMLADARGLEDRGHRVAPFASAHALNDPSPYSDLFPRSVDHGALGVDMGIRRRAATAVRLLHNGTAVAAFDRFVDRAMPEVVHQHGVSRQLSPSVLERAHRRGIPTVLTLHDYSLRCPSGDLSRAGSPVCLTVSCAGHRYDRAVRFSCVHGSRAASAIAAAELLVARAFRRYERSVDLFLTPSDYVADRMRESGLPGDRLRVMPNAIEPPGAAPTVPGDDILAYGRLVGVKGFRLVLEVARKLPHVQFVIAGEGPERRVLESEAIDIPNLRFAGLLREPELIEAIRGALAVIVPSEWPEPFGMVVLEAWREARAVVVTRRGALPEIVQDGMTGIVIDGSDAGAAADAVGRLSADRGLAERLGAAGRREAETTYSMEAHLDRLEATYRELVA